MMILWEGLLLKMSFWTKIFNLGVVKKLYENTPTKSKTTQDCVTLGNPGRYELVVSLGNKKSLTFCCLPS